MAKILIPLADGFEEIEAITSIDVLRRAGIEVITAGIEGNKIVGDHQLKIETDSIIEEVSVKDLDGVVLPGGMPGAENLKNNDILINIIQKLNVNNKLLAAICAAPMVLEEAEVIEGKNATSYPGFASEMPSCNYTEKRVVRDGNIITGRGPGVALEFAIAVVSYFIKESEVSKLKKELLTNF